MTGVWALLVSALLLAANAFFVAAEFALIASKRHRLEAAAAEGSRAARVAVAGTRELSLMLAGTQLGITLCTLGLGALAEPAIAHLLEPLLVAVGLPEDLSYGVAFAGGLVLVVFLHMVVGEMAPKSWSITHPERSAALVALPFRAFTQLVRLPLLALNGMTNGLLRLLRVEPQSELAEAHSPEDLRMLVRQSAEHGLIPPVQQRLLTRVLHLQNTPLSEVMIPWADTVTIARDATASAVEELSRATGHSRFPVTGPDGPPTDLVHVREAVRATTRGQDPAVTDLMSSALTLRADETAAEAVTIMRRRRSQLALVAEAGAEAGTEAGTKAGTEAGTDASPATNIVIGIVALEDLLEELIGEFEDETDFDALAGSQHLGQPSPP
ncbi:hemolysin family protein [Catenulispora yoronensis]|uniref:Hemolysin family protein n=1 Tax=Catenulispora yoronensis TaxID=450799 RepID=A0ABP5H520_9ACTN